MHAKEQTLTAIATCLLCCGMLGAEQTNVIGSGLVSRPVGVVALTVPSGSEVLLSVPFDPFSPALSEVLRGQLTAATNDAGGDLVRFWDSDSGCYCTYEKDASGEWTLISSEPEGTNAAPPGQESPTIEPGKGFVVANRHAVAQQVMLAGALVLDSARAIRLPGGVTLVGYPFTSAKPAAETAIGKAGGTLTGNAFEMAAGYWHAVTSTPEVVWAEQRPYEWPFPLKGEVSIDGLSCDAAGGEVALRISSSVAAPRKIDVLKRDLLPSDRLDNWSGWTLVASDLQIEPGQSISWTDRTLRTDPAFKGVRLYVAACSDAATDLNSNGLPDPREWLCGCTPVGSAASTREGNVTASTVLAGDASVLPSAELVRTSSVPRIVVWSDLIHVDALTGKDAFSGRLNTVSAGDGPKKTIKAALESVREGGTVVVHAGAYSEDLRVSGRSVRVRVDGKVTLRRRPVSTATSIETADRD